MLTQILIAPLFIAASAMAHPAVVRRADVPLSEWSSQNLESYWRFKVRYNSLNCGSQSGTDFYMNCCYPLGATESLSDRPAECTPSSLTCSVSTSSLPTTPPPELAPAPAPAPPAPSGDGDDYDESTLPWCEEGQDEYDDGPYEQESAYNNGSNNGGSSSPDNSTPTDNNTQPPATDNTQPPATDNTQPPATDNGNTGGNSGVQTGGHATFYYQNGNAGACGEYKSDSDLIGAIDSSWWGDMGQRSSHCGQRVHVTNLNNGRSVDIIVADVCPTCDGDNSFDLSVAAFQAIDDLGAGYIPITWSFV